MLSVRMMPPGTHWSENQRGVQQGRRRRRRRRRRRGCGYSGGGNGESDGGGVRAGTSDGAVGGSGPSEVCWEVRAGLARVWVLSLRRDRSSRLVTVSCGGRSLVGGRSLRGRSLVDGRSLGGRSLISGRSLGGRSLVGGGAGCAGSASGMAVPEVQHELVAGGQHAAADVAHLGLAGREVGTMELLALGRVPRQGGGGSASCRQ